MKKLKIFCDGGARGNPGPAGVGFVVCDEKGKVIKGQGRYIGETTNNVAEYRAVLEALEFLGRETRYAKRNTEITFFLDSKLVVNQLNGFYKIKKAHLRDLIIKVRQKEGELGAKIFYQYVPREKNKEADRIVNDVLDERVVK
jgi:ribonuclease HI